MVHRPSRIICFIPARIESSRFPRKPLANLHGKPMIMRVFERASASSFVDEVYVATDSMEIRDTVVNLGGKALLTASDHPSGTDRVAEAARKVGLAGDDIAVNVQGDQPTIEPHLITEVLSPLLADPTIPMSTLIYRIVREQEIHHPNFVKTVIDKEGFAIYFSRARIPFFREEGTEAIYYKHHGIYAYRNDFLQRFAALPQGFLEKAERLEQLRALEHGYRIHCMITDTDSIEVDTLEDLNRVQETYGKIN